MTCFVLAALTGHCFDQLVVSLVNWNLIDLFLISYRPLLLSICSTVQCKVSDFPLTHMNYNSDLPTTGKRLMLKT